MDDELRALIAKWRAEVRARCDIVGDTFDAGVAAGIDDCADQLEALLHARSTPESER